MKFVVVNKAARKTQAQVRDRGYEALHRIADRLAPIIERKLRVSIEDFRKRVDIRDILAALEDGNARRVEGVIPWGELLERYADLRDDIQQAVAEAGIATEAQLRSTLVSTARVPSSELVFNRRNPQAEAWAAQRSGELIRQVTAESRQAVRNVIAETIRSGQDYGKSAQKIKDAVGLTQQGAGAVARLRDGLAARGVRDSVADRMAANYRERLLRARAETISRTETIAATSQGQQVYWQQLADDGVIDPKRARKTWIVTPDDRLCPVCEPLDGVSVGIDEMFKTSLGPVESSPAHPNCRCAVSLEI